MKSLKCMFGVHRWKIVAVNRQFSTRYSKDSVNYWNIDFSICTRCGKRKAFDNVDTDHHGVDTAKKHWKQEGAVPYGTKEFEEIAFRIIDDTPNPAKVITLDVLEGGKK